MNSSKKIDLILLPGFDGTGLLFNSIIKNCTPHFKNFIKHPECVKQDVINQLLDVDYYFDHTGKKHQIHGDDQGPVTTIGVDENGKYSVVEQSGYVGARWRYILRFI